VNGGHNQPAVPAKKKSSGLLPPITNERELWPLVKQLTPADLRTILSDDRAMVVHIRLARLALFSLSQEADQREQALREIRHLETVPPVTPEQAIRDKRPKFKGAADVLKKYADRLSAEQIDALKEVLGELSHMKAQERIAALLFVITGVRTEAARGAGYSGAAAHASRMFKRPHVQAAVGQLQQCMEEHFVRRLIYHRERVLQRYEEMAEFNALPYVGQDGLDVDGLKKAYAAGGVYINSLELDSAPDQGRRKIKLQFADPRAANDRLAAITGLLQPKEVSAAAPPVIVALGIFGSGVPPAREELAVQAEKDVTPATP
jgi:phage terminase small subunit